MKKLIFVIILILIANSVLATTFLDYKDKINITDKRYLRVDWYNSAIKGNATQLKGASVEQTIWNTYNFQQEIHWKFYNERRGPDVTLRTMEGDCTDISELGILLLRINGVYAKQVHGYYIPRMEKHDWMEILYPENNTVHWRTIDYINEEDLLKIGDGIW